MKKILLACLFLLFSLPVAAAELLMFSNPHCSYCQSFLNEVKPTYYETEYSEYLPLKVITMEGDMPEWIAKAFDEGRLQPIRETPTFIIWDDKEIARLIGYRNKETFFELLGSFIEQNETVIHKQPKHRRSVPHQQHPTVPFMAPEGVNMAPEGVTNSKNIFDHTYQTPKEALKAAEWLRCGGNIHYHKHEKVWMPCSMK